MLISRVKTSRPVKEKRLLLEHEFLKKSPRSNICVQNFDFEIDKSEIDITLEFESGSITDSFCRRIAPQLNHIRGRIVRMPISEADLGTTRRVRDELYATLEEDLRDVSALGS